uniref:Skp1-related protein n=1 Tax=Globodera pallida TaxID=36090 RepID=A0A183CBW1_GLOPA
MGAEKENTLPAAANTSKQSAASEENRLQNKVKCACSDGDVPVRLALLPQCNIFSDMTQTEDIVFSIPEVSVDTFKKVVEWMEHRADKDEPKVEMDPTTHERKWFELDDFETKFFKMDVVELAYLLSACNYLQINSLFVYACQAMAALLKTKTVEQLRNFLGIDEKDWLSEKRMAGIREKNAWYKY